MVLNIHFYEMKVAEQVRLSCLMNNGCFVVSEGSDRNDFAEGMVTGSYDGLTGLCEQYLADPEARGMVAARGLELFRQRPMVGFLEPLIETLPPGLICGAKREEILT